MKGGNILLIGGILAGAAVVGVAVALLSKSAKKKTTETVEDKESEKIIPVRKKDVEDEIEETKEEVFEDIQTRHNLAVEAIKEAMESIKEEKVKDYKVDSIHSELDNMIDEL